MNQTAKTTLTSLPATVGDRQLVSLWEQFCQEKQALSRLQAAAAFALAQLEDKVTVPSIVLDRLRKAMEQ